MPAYKLYYFDTRGRAEAIRLALHYRGVPFEDVRLQHADWPERKNGKQPFFDKPIFPNGQVPVLEIDGVALPQSYAILRHLGQKLKLNGNDEMETAQLDAVLELFRDFIDQIRPYLQAVRKGEGNVEELRETKFIPGTEKYLPKLEALLEAAGSGFYGRSGVSYVDFFICEALRNGLTAHPTYLDAYPRVKAQIANVDALPELQSYLQTRKN